MRKNPYLLLIRPANLITAATDIAAGAAIAITLALASEVSATVGSFLLLVLSSVFLYAGGIAFNDVFDAELDRLERPERPIPSGTVSRPKAGLYAGCLLLAGILIAFAHHQVSGILATSIALLTLSYNSRAKHHPFFGPFNMGILRSLNLLLGVSLLPHMAAPHFYLGIFPLIYIFAITMISRGEVHGGSRNTLYLAMFLFVLVDAGIWLYSLTLGKWFMPLIFVIIHLIYVLPSLRTAIRIPEGSRIGAAVKHGVLGMILMDAIWVSLSPYWIAAFVMILLLPLSQKLARHFAVT